MDDGPGDDANLVVPDADVKACTHGVGLPRTSLEGRRENMLWERKEGSEKKDEEKEEGIEVVEEEEEET